MNIEHIVLFFEAAALAAAFINFKKLKVNGLGWFLILLTIICLVEWGNLFKLYSVSVPNSKYRSNAWVFNLVVHPAELLCYTSVYYRFFKQAAIRKIIVLLASLVVVFMIYNVCFLQPLYVLNTYPYILMCCVFVYFAYLYFTKAIYGDIDKKLTKSAYYWISLGGLLFFSGEAALFAFFQYFLDIDNFEVFSGTFMFLSNILNYILYTCLIISFFCQHK